MSQRDGMIGLRLIYEDRRMKVIRTKRECGVDWAYLAPVKGPYSLDDVVKVNVAGIQELRSYVYRD